MLQTNLKFLLTILTLIILITYPVYGQSDEDKLSRGINKLVKQIAKYDRIDTESVGFSARRTTQYKRFIQLTNEATSDELLILMKHKNPVVRGYVFWALAKQFYPDLDNVYQQHLNDDEYIYVFDHCMAGEIPLNAFMNQVITSNMIDMNCKKLKD